MATLRARPGFVADRWQWPRPPASLRGVMDALCLSRLRARFHGVPVRLELWNGTIVQLSAAKPIATIRINDRATLFALVLRPPELGFGDAYTAGGLEVRGDLTGLLEQVNRLLAGRTSRSGPPSVLRRVGASAGSARANVHHHYDLSNEFYRLWLDPGMVYTCAYFERPDATLEEAQLAKMRHICRKLRLRPGDRVIEAGCGWGALALHMAREHDVTVRAYNISREQLAFARDRALQEGLAHRVSFIDADYRAIEGQCDAFVSVGMLEHVGPGRYAERGDAIDRVLDKSHGRGLLHFIGRNSPSPFNAWTSRYIFPGAYAPTLGEASRAVLEPSGLSIVDVENLRLHYARTLEHWRTRFDQQEPRVREIFDERFVRTWRLYLAMAEAGFRSGELQLFQVTFLRQGDNDLPATRRALYGDRPDADL